MSVLSTIGVIFNGRLSKIGTLQLDASVAETHTSKAELTSHPVEEGASVTDHSNRLPDKIVMRGLVTNTPITFPEALPGVPIIQSLANLLGNVQRDRSQSAYDTLRELVDAKELVTIITPLREYVNMLLSELEVLRDAASASSLAFTVEATEVRLVKSTSLNILSAATLPSEKRGQNKKSVGKKPAAEAKVVQRQSGLSKIAEQFNKGIL